MSEKLIKYSEIFYSPQGEGPHTGIPYVWLRLWGCNFQCRKFGYPVESKNPQDWKNDFEAFDVKKVKRIEDLPVWKTGCDSSYSWAAKFKNLAPANTAAEIARRLWTVRPESAAKSGQRWGICFTGGEPLLPVNQRAIVDILTEFEQSKRLPPIIAFETNGTQIISEALGKKLTEISAVGGKEIMISVSPKLYSVSGETRDKAIRPDVVYSYQQYGVGNLKFVVSDHPECWDELEHVVQAFRAASVSWDVWIMPVGATYEDQHSIAGAVAREAIRRGYNISARLQAFLFGNAIGT